MTYLKPAAVVLLAFAFGPGAALSGGSTESQPVAYPVEDSPATPPSCEQARRDAEFLRELKKTDGDVNPELGALPECTEGEQKV
jgi:hypothetical protein